MVRNPAVSGLFYESGKVNLENEIKSCFLGKLGPKSLPSKKRNGVIKGVISPHAGYTYSGMCAAHGFNIIGKSEVSDIYFIIGPNHYGYKSAFSSVDWKTPLGILKCDRKFVKELSYRTGIPIDESMHEKEHSIEVQLPFLQFVNKNSTDFKIVCLTLSSDINVYDVSKKIRAFVKDSGKSVVFLISSDFTHYGERFGYVPFFSNKDNNLKNLDMGAINFVLKKDAGSFLKYVEDTEATICGYIPIAVFLGILEKEKGNLLCYYDSSTISDDADSSVSYASIVFK